MKAINLPTIKEIVLKELKELSRDKKIIILAVVIPIAIYPFVFFGIDKLFSIQESKLKSIGATVSLTGDSAMLLPYLRDAEYTFTFVTARTPDAGLNELNADLAVEIESGKDSNRSLIWILYDGSRDESIMAYRHLTKHLELKRPEWVRDRIVESGLPVSRLPSFHIEMTDIASPEARSGHKIGKILPFILVLMLTSGCAFTAVDLIAGEKERGCFETILVTSIDRRDLIIGKFLVVLVTGLVSAFLNLLGMVLTLKLGLFQSREGFDFAFELPVSTLGGIFVCTLPLGILFAAVLMVFSAKARTFQEGQLYLMPFTLLVLIPTFIVALPDIHSNSYVILIPVANIAVVMREYLEKAVNVPFFILANVVNLAYAGLILNWAIGYLETEGSLVTRATAAPSRIRRFDETRASVMTFVLVWLTMYFIMAPLQEWNLIGGLLITLYGLILPASLLHVKILKLPFRETFSLALPHWKAWPAVVPMTLGMLSLAQWLTHYQMQILPFPESLGRIFQETFQPEGITVWFSMFLFGISPGICEELLFRGAILGTLRRKLTPFRYILISSVLFAFVHFSVYRFFPVILLGLGFGYIAFRAKSIYPAMFAHALNNIVAIHLLPKYIPHDMPVYWYLTGLPLLAAGVYVFESINRNRTDIKRKVMHHEFLE
ncbi:CPBP family intramembrane metalloprotease [bacterium]|nr:CPBP family intramembrane metalloprotease [candidate division CSSED10-310 bacterium]